MVSSCVWESLLFVVSGGKYASDSLSVVELVEVDGFISGDRFTGSLTPQIGFWLMSHQHT
jgi:hypothetical protein